MKTCLICATECAPDAHTCLNCGCADFAPTVESSADESNNDAVPSGAVDTDAQASPNNPGKRRK